MRFSDHILDEIRARLPVSHVAGRKVALKKKGREFAGLSPFKMEKTPSFFVNDAKGFYHCFASGEHGDIFKFVMRTEGLSFPEAVERLAAEAGVPLPRASERDERREDERARLHALTEAAARFFEARLAGPGGTEARRYLERRGVAPATAASFRLGYAPASRSALREQLSKAGFKLEEMIAAGMLVSGDDIPVAYDRFRHRLMFPITDLKGRVIAFGGRALDADQQPKYLNSPETPLFHKGSVLFNAAQARSAAHEAGRIIAVEGYMDVVALAEAGFPECVAPLGTALTEEQVKLLWRFAPEPIICFDGDGAGQKAAFRAAEIALPHLEPGFSLSFAVLPEGVDPDDLVRQQGPDALADVLSRTRPLADMLWGSALPEGAWATPERRAGVERHLMALCSRIGNPSVRGYYERDMRQRLFEAARPPRSTRQAPGAAGGRDARGASGRVAGRWDARPGAGRAGYEDPHAGTSLRNSRLAAEAGVVPAREALLIRTLLNHPWLVEDHAEDISRLTFSAGPLSRLREAILELCSSDNSLDSATLHSQLTGVGLDSAVKLVAGASTHGDDAFAESRSGRAEVEAGWGHVLALHQRLDGLQRSLDAAEEEWHADLSAEAYERTRVLHQEIEQLSNAERHAGQAEAEA